MSGFHTVLQLQSIFAKVCGRVGAMSNALSFYSVLLVSEFEVTLGSVRDCSHVI